jgi:hypothetical protein
MNQAEHEWAQEVLGEYAAERLSAGEAARLEAHVATCEACSAETQDPAEDEIPTGEPVVETAPRPGIAGRVKALLGSVLKPRTAASRGFVVAAVVALLGIVGFVLSEMEPDRARRPPTKRGMGPPPARPGAAAGADVLLVQDDLVEDGIHRKRAGSDPGDHREDSLGPEGIHAFAGRGGRPQAQGGSLLLRKGVRTFQSLGFPDRRDAAVLASRLSELTGLPID